MLGRKEQHLALRKCAQSERRSAHELRKMDAAARSTMQSQRQRDQESREPWLASWSDRQALRMQREEGRLLEQESTPQMTYAAREEDDASREAETEPFQTAREAHAKDFVSNRREESAWQAEAEACAKEGAELSHEMQEWRPPVYEALLERLIPEEPTGEITPLHQRLMEMRENVAAAEAAEPFLLTDEDARRQVALTEQALEGDRLAKESKMLRREKGAWDLLTLPLILTLTRRLLEP